MSLIWDILKEVFLPLIKDKINQSWLESEKERIRALFGEGFVIQGNDVYLSQSAVEELARVAKQKGIEISLATEEKLPDKFQKGKKLFELDGYRFRRKELILIYRPISINEHVST